MLSPVCVYLLSLLFPPHEYTIRLCLVYGHHRPVKAVIYLVSPALAPQGPADKSVIEGNDCTFVSDFRKIQLQSNTETLGERESVESWLEGCSSV